MHVDNGDALLGIRLRPGAGSAGPAELAELSVVVSAVLVLKHAHAVAVAVADQIIIIEVVLQNSVGEGIGAHKVYSFPAHDVLTVIDAAVREHLHELGVVPAVRDDAGETGYGAERTDHGGLAVR